jgi:hypothetical protein
MPMRQLRNCDFCGGDAAGVYEVLPPELSPTEAEQRRLVLCADCAETLETVVDPLLERLGVETGEDTSTTSDGSPASGGAAGADPPPSETAPSTGPAETATPESDEAPPESDPGDSDDPSDPDDTNDSGDPNYGISFEPGDPAESPADRSTAADGAVQWDEIEPTTSASEAADSDGDEADEPEPAADADGPEPASDGRAGGRGESGDAGSTLGDEPEDFRTVMRLLSNREFPVERGAIVELATNAYELDEQHVHRIIDHAIDRGVIVDDGGTLRRD